MEEQETRKRPLIWPRTGLKVTQSGTCGPRLWSQLFGWWAD